MNSDQIFGLTLVVIFGVVVPGMLAIAIPMGKAWARRVGAHPGADPQTLDEVVELRHRLAELEERVDFTERMLAQQREPERLPEGHRP
jgi:hypothetical protein